MARRLYTLLLLMVAPVFWLLLWRRARREGGAWQVLHAQRFGRAWRCTLEQPPVWVHAVSLGETRAVEPLVAALLAQGDSVLLTHTTATARSAAGERFAEAIAAGRLQPAWLPYDFPGAMRRFVRATRACQLLLVEREIWPNLLAACAEARLPVILINARLSERSAAGLRRLRYWYRPALRSLSAVLAQTQADAQRLEALGAPAVQVTGNLKFDVQPDMQAQAEGAAWRRAWSRPVLMFASSRDGEEALWLQALAQHPASQVCGVVVPRHAPRFSEVAQLLEQSGQPWARRSELPDPAQLASECRYLLGDSMGEMSRYYGAADVAIMGGSFADFGGQNLLEACAAGVPVIVGPSTRNFAQAVSDAVAAGAAVQVGDMSAAVAQALQWLAQPRELAHRRQAAQRFVAAHQGATQRTLEACRRMRRAMPDKDPAIGAASGR